MIILRFILLPFTLIYALIIALRNFLYQARIINRTSFNIPIICIGNIAVGGTGKTPHIEWIIESLQSTYKLAVLSRGYKRKTTGYVLATENETPLTVGDEPFQIAQKFPDIAVAVCENRVLGVPSLLGDVPTTELILMDDGFQHLPIKPGYSIVLTDYSNLFFNDWLMPSGTLREFRSAYKRAQCIIVTKCPTTISEKEKEIISQKINPLPHQLILFSVIEYGELKPIFKHNNTPESPNHVLAFSGIANEQPFLAELNKRFHQVSAINFSDHQEYSLITLSDIAERYRALQNNQAILVTTEKDAVKLHTQQAENILGQIPIYYLPIHIRFLDNGSATLIAAITQFISSFVDSETSL
jgi:tetraacyldisaccharide 4'-kinase